MYYTYFKINVKILGSDGEGSGTRNPSYLMIRDVGTDFVYGGPK